MDLELAVGISGAAEVSERARREVRELAERLVDGSHSGNERACCPADQRINTFLNTYFAGQTRQNPLRLPGAIALPRYGIARELSFPAGGRTYRNEYVTSYRLRNGVLHNPAQ